MQVKLLRQRLIWFATLTICFVIPCALFAYRAIFPGDELVVLTGTALLLPWLYGVAWIVAVVAVRRAIHASRRLLFASALRGKWLLQLVGGLFVLSLLLFFLIEWVPDRAVAPVVLLAVFSVLLGLVLLLFGLITGRFRSSSWHHQPSRVHKVIVETTAALEERRPQEGLSIADAALERDPNRGWLLNQRAVCLIGLGRVDEAIEDLETVRKIQRMPLATYNLAVAHFLHGNLDRADGLVEEACEAVPQDPTPVCQRGLIAFEAGRLDLAAECFERACELKGDNAEALAGRALVAVERGEGSTDDAREWIERAIEIEPLDPLVLLSSARWHQVSGDLKTGRQRCAAAIARLGELARAGSASYYEKLAERWGIASGS